MRDTILAMGMLLGLLGCGAQVTSKTPEATGGSRADGIVEMSYEAGVREQVEIDWERALERARQRCQAWNYSDAEPFGGQKYTCQIQDGGTCLRRFITIPYQCTGSQAANP